MCVILAVDVADSFKTWRGNSFHERTTYVRATIFTIFGKGFLFKYPNKKPRGIDALLDKMANNDHIKMDNIEIKVHVSL